MIKFGVDADEGATEETVLIRGISADVDRAVKEILQIVESAKNDEIVNSYVSRSNILSDESNSVDDSLLNSISNVNMLDELLVLKVLVSTSLGINLVSRSMSMTRKKGRVAERKRKALDRRPRLRSPVVKRMLRKPRNVSWPKSSDWYVLSIICRDERIIICFLGRRDFRGSQDPS